MIWYCKWKKGFEIWKIRVFIGALHPFENVGIHQTMQLFNGVKAEKLKKVLHWKGIGSAM